MLLRTIAIAFAILGASSLSAQAVVTGAFSVQNYGAVGHGAVSATQDQAAFTAAITAACATATGAQGGVVLLQVPQPPSSYNIATPLTLCSNLHIQGVGGYPTITFTGTGTSGAQVALFTNASGDRNIEIDHLDLEGQAHAYAWAYYAQRTSGPVISSLNVRIHDLVVSGFGSGTYNGTGGTIWIDNDSAGNSIYNNLIGGTGTLLNISHATDRLHVYDNFLESTSGGALCISGTNGLGAGTVLIDHNIFNCDGGGAMNLNSLATWIIADNEEESTGAISNTNSAVFDFESASSVLLLNNSSNAHGAAAYDYYVANAIVISTFTNNFGSNATTKSFHVGNGNGNAYANNNSSLGPSGVYDADYAGIYSPLINNGAGVSFGCGATATTTQIPFTFCGEIRQQSAGTATSVNQYWFTPNLGVGNTQALVGGAANSTNNAWQLSFNNVGGSGSPSNTVTLGLGNGIPLTITPTGIKAGSYTVGSTAGVSCSGPPTALFAVTNGIVTHC